MASLSRNQKNGRFTIQCVLHGKRKSIRLGNLSKHAAVSFRSYAEKLVAAKLTNHPIDSETALWIADLDSSLHERLAAIGLVMPRKPDTETELGPFLDDYVANRLDVKPATLEVWSQVVRNLKAYFGVERLLNTIAEGDAEAFKSYLQGEGLASTTVSKRLTFARMFFRAAVKRKLTPDNPFADVSSIGIIPKDRQQFVTLEDFEQLVAVCDPTWRTIFALCRLGGLRCPSEVLSLRWQDVDLKNGRIEVQSPKTEHHEGKESRTIPVFEELRPYLEDAAEVAEPGAVYVVGGNHREQANTSRGWRNINLRTHALRLIERASLKPWPRLFHNLRSSRETELVKKFPIHVVTAWLGNSPKIALKHYLQVTNQDFELASGQGAAKSAARTLQNAVQQPTADSDGESQKRRKPLRNQGLASSVATPSVLLLGANAERAGDDFLKS